MQKQLFRFRKLILILLMLYIPVLTGCSARNTAPASPVESVKDEQAEETQKAEKIQNLVQCVLCGEMVREGTTDRRPLAIMIENAPEARPQSGLDKADIIYEILAEGAITRFLAVYLHGDAEKVGPVRSSRPYYIERMLEYDAIYAYCGGSEAAKEMVLREKVASLDEFGIGSGPYWRTKDRKAPHNLYTNTNKLREVAAKRGYEKTVQLPTLNFLGEGEENPGGTVADNLVINYLRSYSAVWWKFDTEQKKYKRFQAGSPHRDAVSSSQLTASNILVQYTNTKVIDSVGRLKIDMIGRGQAELFTGGKVYQGSWSKKSTRAQTFFYGEDGIIFRLNPGQTWIEVVPTNAKIEWSVASGQ